ncbi:24025_t:CDS:2, partial [Dentiscutata erythropus]
EALMKGQIRITSFDSGSLRREIGDSTELSIQRENQTGQRLEINNNRINLDNILANPGVSYQQTVDGVQLRIEYISARLGTFQDAAVLALWC